MRVPCRLLSESAQWSMTLRLRDSCSILHPNFKEQCCQATCDGTLFVLLSMDSPPDWNGLVQKYGVALQVSCAVLSCCHETGLGQRAGG
jgi:hypothetical protein